MSRDRRTLFVSYNATSEPLVKSQVLPYLKALSSEGVKFHLLSFEKGPGASDDVRDELRASHVDWIRLKFHNKPVFLAKCLDIKLGILATLWVSITRKVNVVHARGIMGAIISIIPARITGARFIFDMKSSLAEAYRLSGKIKEDGVYYKILDALERMCVSISDVVIVETRTHKDALLKLLSSKKTKPRIEVMPCCVEMSRFDIKEAPAVKPADSIRLAYLGSISGWYMLPEMLSFFKEFKCRRRNTEMVFMTDDKEGCLKKAVCENGIDGVSVMNVPYKDVPARLSAATFAILFKWPYQRLDSFPIKVGEYLASGLPVIINAGMGDVELLIRENKIGVVVKSMDAAGFEKAFREMEDIIAELPAVRARCREVAAKRLSSSWALSLYRTVYEA